MELRPEQALKEVSARPDRELPVIEAIGTTSEQDRPTATSGFADAPAALAFRQMQEIFTEEHILFRGLLEARLAEAATQGASRTAFANARVRRTLDLVQELQRIAVLFEPIAVYRAVPVCARSLGTPSDAAELRIPTKERIKQASRFSSTLAATAVAGRAGVPRAVGMGATSENRERTGRARQRVSVQPISTLVRLAISPASVRIRTTDDFAGVIPMSRRHVIRIVVPLHALLAASA